MSYLVANPEDRFSRYEAHMSAREWLCCEKMHSSWGKLVSGVPQQAYQVCQSRLSTLMLLSPTKGVGSRMPIIGPVHWQ